MSEERTEQKAPSPASCFAFDESIAIAIGGLYRRGQSRLWWCDTHANALRRMGCSQQNAESEASE